MTRLSVNINKVATLRNARGGNLPDLLVVARDCQAIGAQGITVHPRPDERHIRYQDVYDLKPIVKTEFNIEGYPDKRWLQLVKDISPEQATLVPDSPDVLTSDTGWDTISQKGFLEDIIGRLHESDIRVSLFVDPIEQFVEGAKAAGADRIELYTGPYASLYHENRQKAVGAYKAAAEYAEKIGLKVNAGHDLSLRNLKYLKQQIPFLAEVSIGHALISDALYYGLENTIQMYLRQLSEDKE